MSLKIQSKILRDRANKILKKFFPIETLQIYWDAYGGWAELKGSVYLRSSLVLSVLTILLKTDGFSWASSVIDIVPDILGFSLGGYALLIGFGDSEFIEALRGRDPNGASPYMKVNAAFVHFIIIESLTLLFSFFTQAIGIDSNFIIEFAGTLLLFYTIATLFAATLAILTFAFLYDNKPK